MPDQGLYGWSIFGQRSVLIQELELRVNTHATQISWGSVRVYTQI